MSVVQRVTRRPVKRPKRGKAGFRLVLLLLTGVLIIAGVLGVASLRRSATTLIARVPGQAQMRIDLNQSLALSPYLFGSNVFPLLGTASKDPGGQGFMSYDPQIIAGLRSAGVKLLRFPGGNFGEEHTLSPQQLDAFSYLLNQVGAQGLMQVQLSDPLDKKPVPLTTRASRAALLVEYMNNPQSIQRGADAPYHAVKYWSVGNEPDLLTNPDTNKPYTVAEYTQAFIAYSLAMHLKDPNIQVFGPELSRYTEAGSPEDSQGIFWMQGFLQGVSDYERTHSLPFHLLDGVSFHYYPFPDGQQDVATLLSDPPQWDTLVPGLRQLIRQTFDKDLPIAITEINTNAVEAPPAQNLAALWWAETLGKLMSNQADYVAFFSAEGVDSPQPLFLQKDDTQTALLRVMQLLSHVQARLVPVQGVQGTISVYATQDASHASVSLFFVNQSSRNLTITVQAEDSLPWGSWQALQSLSSWQAASLTLQGYGMAVLTLHRGGNDDVFSFDNTARSQQQALEIQHAVCSRTTGDC